jgi:hypothetical protein
LLCEPSLLAVWENADPPLFLSQNRDKFDGSAGHPISPQGKVSTLGSKVRIRFKVSVIENACLVGRAVDLMTNDRFLEGYSLIRDLQANDFLIALRMLAEHGVMIKKLCDFKERHKTKETESIAALLTRAAETGDEEAISLLAAGALERRV